MMPQELHPDMQPTLQTSKEVRSQGSVTAVRCRATAVQSTGAVKLEKGRMRVHERVDSQGGSLDEGREEQGGGGPHAHARQLPGGRVHGAVGQRPAGLALGLAEHLRPESHSLGYPLRTFTMVSVGCGGAVMLSLHAVQHLGAVFCGRCMGQRWHRKTATEAVCGYHKACQAC